MPENRSKIIMWDMAGTLIPFDPETGRPRSLPDCEDFLPELAREFRMVCTTGDSTAGARTLLESFEILPHLETIFGNLGQSVGKPYGEVLRQLAGQPAHSLVVGDRLRADVPSDCEDLVTILINQDGKLNSAGMVSYMIHVLNRQSADDYATAFRHLTITAAIDKDSLGQQAGGNIVAAWRRNDGFDYRLWMFAHDSLSCPRPVIVLGAGPDQQ